MPFPKLFPVRVGYFRPFPGNGKTDGNVVRSAWHWKSNSPSAVLTLLTRLAGWFGIRKGEFRLKGKGRECLWLSKVDTCVSLVRYFFSFHVFFFKGGE